MARARTPDPAERAASLEQLLAAKEIMLSCGSGGVGKTTTAAAAGAMAAVHLGGKVLVVTVDPVHGMFSGSYINGRSNPCSVSGVRT
jgi:Mrp family chromosome partitioning ATPase